MNNNNFNRTSLANALAGYLRPPTLPSPRPNTLAYYAQRNLWPAPEHQVGWYIDRNGRCVPAHYRTDPNHTKRDNYTTRGNVNLHTGQPGTRSLGLLDPINWRR